VDVQNDILDLMDFKPLIADPLLPLTWDWIPIVCQKK
jgi:acyl CoA:acetate/3-ketoacid CoA transferase